MGEYASYGGHRIKIGTCESMYYLRAEQASEVRAESGNVDPVRARDSIRFRFPFPAEDGIRPGDFEHPVPVVIVDYPEGLPAEHGTVSVQTDQSAPKRLSAFLPCPTAAPEIWHQHVRQNAPAVRIEYQGYRNGHLAVIVSCAYCDGMWNLPARADAETLVVSIRSRADALQRQAEMRREDTLRRHGPGVGDPAAENEMRQATELHEIATRILAGYASEDGAE